MIKTKGGYMMIDLAHVSLSGLGVTFAGLYQKLYSKIGKPILLCNVNIGGTEYQDCYVQPVYTAEGFEMTVGDYTITVASNSVVTATEGIVGGGGEGGASALSQLTDVDLGESLQGGEVLMYDGEEHKWVNGEIPTPEATDLDDLDDVGIDTMTLADGDALVFDSTAMKWTNKPVKGNQIAGTNGEPLLIVLAPGASLPVGGSPADLTQYIDSLPMTELSALALALKDGESVIASLVISAHPTFTLEGSGAVVITKTDDVYTNLYKLTVQSTPLFTDMDSKNLYVARCYLSFDGNGDVITAESSLLLYEANTTT